MAIWTVFVDGACWLSVRLAGVSTGIYRWVILCGTLTFGIYSEALDAESPPVHYLFWFRPVLKPSSSVRTRHPCEVAHTCGSEQRKSIVEMMSTLPLPYSASALSFVQLYSASALVFVQL